jgi:hypothetical protein
MQSMYCYVDESGQHTQGAFFVIAVVIVNSIELRDEGERMLLEIEKKTGKESTKWSKTNYVKKDRYIRAIATMPKLKNCLFCSIYTDTRDYVNLTIGTIAQVIEKNVPDIDEYRVKIVVDGMNKKEAEQAAKLLNERVAVSKKVRGAKDESSPWIRLADAIAGFRRDAYEDKPYTQNLYSDIQRCGFLIQL